MCPGSVYHITSLMPPTNPRGGHWLLHCAETQRGEATCPRSLSQSAADLGSKAHPTLSIEPAMPSEVGPTHPDWPITCQSAISNGPLCAVVVGPRGDWGPPSPQWHLGRLALLLAFCQAVIFSSAQVEPPGIGFPSGPSLMVNAPSWSPAEPGISHAPIDSPPQPPLPKALSCLGGTLTKAAWPRTDFLVPFLRAQWLPGAPEKRR